MWVVCDVSKSKSYFLMLMDFPGVTLLLMFLECGVRTTHLLLTKPLLKLCMTLHLLPGKCPLSCNLV
jgi:hypothetical protein